MSATSDRDHIAGMEQFRNTQEHLERAAPKLVEERKAAGLEGLVGDLAGVVIMVEAERQRDAVQEMQRWTGLDLVGAYRGPNYVTAVLSVEATSCRFSSLPATPKEPSQEQQPTPKVPEGGGSAEDKRQDAAPTLPADLIIRSRHRPEENPFRALNQRPKSAHLPNTRLETFVFECFDLEEYVAIQKARGVRFATERIVETDTYAFIQTLPSDLIGATYGFIQWRVRPRTWGFAGGKKVEWDVPAPPTEYRRRIGQLDHVATRVRARDRDEAILEFIRLTNHTYRFSIYVEGLNSITNVTRRSEQDVGLVFTSGISPYVNDEVSGPTEKFIHNYGPRAHHLAFATEDIERTFAELKADGRTFLIDLVGGPGEGLHQTFSTPSEHTLLVTEYIHRYGGFTGYFTKSNVTALTEATAKQ